MPTLTIGGETYNVYADVAAADKYLAASIAAEVWRDTDTTPDVKARALVSATRWIDEQQWQDGYTTFAERVAVPAFVTASIELAAALVDDPDLRTSMRDTATKRLKAGSVEIESFRGSAVEVTTAFPTNVMGLIGQWLAARAGRVFGGARAFGTCRPSEMEDGFELNRGL